MKFANNLFILILILSSFNSFAYNLDKSETNNFKFEIERSEMHRNGKLSNREATRGEADCLDQQIDLIALSLESLIVDNHYPASAFNHIRFNLIFKANLLFNKAALASSTYSNFTLVNIAISEENIGGCNLISSDIITRKLLQQARENKPSEGASILDQALSIRLY